MSVELLLHSSLSYKRYNPRNYIDRGFTRCGLLPVKDSCLVVFERRNHEFVIVDQKFNQTKIEKRCAIPLPH